MSRGAGSGRAGRTRMRRCLVSGEALGDEALLRVGLSPEGVVTPDLAAKLPGRGAWVKADRASVETAVRKRLFNRAFSRPVEAPADLADAFERQLEARALSLLGLARRAGRLATGYDAVRLALKADPPPAWRIEAVDAAADGRGKLDRLARKRGAIPTAGCFSSEALGAALGRDALMHLALAPGGEARAFGETMAKLAGFRAIDPRGDGPESETGGSAAEPRDSAQDG
ncbi:RNA-binding protein [Marinicauda salina]|uniref:RNA-binding protein n=1 Tax=Marinicauda salina TaxID=2135793 RepID=A0A2U2BWG3_9PROT|nr:RNA-binding protein [Marinicauda salina]PWE18319.1 RNA-binding protein [Marinicauda salina]